MLNGKPTRNGTGKSAPMSTTASRTSGRATVTTVCPGETTCPTSALTAVTTPAKSVLTCA